MLAFFVISFILLCCQPGYKLMITPNWQLHNRNYVVNGRRCLKNDNDNKAMPYCSLPYIGLM
jgi:hypothetical protein